MSETEALETHLQELRRGTAVLACLRLLETPGYGYGLLEELSARGFDTDANTLYPLLRRLEKQGHLTSEWNTDEARPRKFYRTSAAGSRLAAALTADFHAIATAIAELPAETKDRRTDMDTTTLTDRYVSAAMRTVPEKHRGDLAAELRASIADQIDARVENGEPREVAERAVLNELGTEKLAAGYTERPLHLIGPRYYLDWWRLLGLLLWIVLPAAAFGIALAQTLAGEGFGTIVGTLWVTLLSVAVHVCFWTTLVFVIIERTGVDRKEFGEWNLDQLPEPRPRGGGFADLIASLIFLAVGAGAIIWDLTIGFVPAFVSSADAPLSFLNPDLVPWWIAGLFVIMALEATLAVVVYLVRRWTPALAVANAVLALAFAVPALVLLTQGKLLNPEFFPTIIGEDGAEVAAIVSTVFGFGIAILAIWDIVDVARKAIRSRH